MDEKKIESVDFVGNIIKLKAQKKAIEEQIKANEVMIFNDDELRSDPRITIVKGRETITLTDDAYERLEEIGIETTIKIERRKDLGEFAKDIQEVLLSNEENYTKKISKESIRVKEVKK